ncbi:MAG: hypothetical protein KKB03_01085 [Nanoarchaeota archaeon]|nr:hypothetical protein [Nanoarchaeota archaeon]
MGKRKVRFLGGDSNGFVYFTIDCHKHVKKYNIGCNSFANIYINKGLREPGDYSIELELIGDRKLQTLIKKGKISEEYKFLRPLSLKQIDSIVYDLESSLYGAEVISVAPKSKSKYFSK